MNQTLSPIFFRGKGSSGTYRYPHYIISVTVDLGGKGHSYRDHKDRYGVI